MPPVPMPGPSGQEAAQRACMQPVKALNTASLQKVMPPVPPVMPPPVMPPAHGSMPPGGPPPLVKSCASIEQRMQLMVELVPPSRLRRGAASAASVPLPALQAAVRDTEQSSTRHKR
ncbi:MAG: hypothetical protein U1A78_41420 [Polyangia bacterium]